MNSLFPDLFDEGKTPEAPAAAQPTPEYDLTDLFERLSHSPFRSRFRLKPADIAYIREKGMDTIRQHAADFVRKRLAPAVIPNDGNRRPCGGIRSSSPSMPRAAVAGDASPSGTIFRRAALSHPKNSAMPWPY